MSSGPSRRALTVAVAASAGAVGLGAQWWWGRRGAEPTPVADGTDADSAQALWPLRFDKPGGGTLVMAELRGHPLVINFWATWCPPCVKELPELQRFQAEFRDSGWWVVALAIDREAAVVEFLARMPLDLTVALGGIDGANLSLALGNRQNGLPFSAMVDTKGQIVRRKSGQTSFDELAGWARALTS